jgi:hypothetical protein
MSDMHKCPQQFSSTLAEFVEQHVSPNLLPEEGVAAFHKGLVLYLNSNEATYILRKMGETVRFRKGLDETIYSTNESVRFKASDNFPAWWIHYLLFHGDKFESLNSFQKLIDDIPMHLHSKPGPSINASRGKTIKSFGYHVAHIYDVKDGNTDYKNYSKEEMIKRFVRNIHPLNYFYIAKGQWRKFGGTIAMRALFANLFSNRYRGVWDEFTRLILPTNTEAKELIYDDAYASFHYCYGKHDKKNIVTPLRKNIPINIAVHWTNKSGWKPRQLRTDMELLEKSPIGSKIRFKLLKDNQLGGCVEMDIEQWKKAMVKHMETDSWLKKGWYHNSLNSKENGRHSKVLKTNWKQYEKFCINCKKPINC